MISREKRPTSTISDDPWEHQVHVPKWARPGIHALDPESVSAGKTDIGAAGIGAALSPYFAKHKPVMDGLIRMYLLFQWRAADVNVKGPRVLPPPDTDYLQMVEILREIRDTIDPAMDGQPSDEVYLKGRRRYENLLKSGCIDSPLLGGGDSKIMPTPVATSRSRSRKRPTEGSAGSGRGSKRSAQGPSFRGSGSRSIATPGRHSGSKP